MGLDWAPGFGQIPMIACEARIFAIRFTLKRGILVRRELGDNGFAEALHFLELGAELEEKQIDSGLGEAVDLILDLRRGSDEAGTETAIGDRIFFDGDGALELSSLEPLLVVGIAGRILFDVGDALDFAAGFLLGDFETPSGKESL